MPIHVLPQFEADLEQYEEDRKAYQALSAPKTLVVRFGAMKLVGEFPTNGDIKPGCGTKLIVRTFRGVELGEMLTTTCQNAGCGKSVSRKELLEFIKNSGGKDYPFYTNGRVLRVATMEDMDRQEALEQSRHPMKLDARRRVERLGLRMHIVDAEPILGGERLTIYYTAEERTDFRELIRELGIEHGTRIEMRQVGARDEARVVADYEKCGQYCCCKNFLKVLKPVSMRSAKVQKATLDPLKISGRCGRLMCCLRYEDQTYTELKKRLPNRKTRVGTPDGDGLVISTQILTQLVLVQLDKDDSQVAVPIEDISPPDSAVAVKPEPVTAARREKRRPRGPVRDRTAQPSAKRERETPIADAGLADSPTRKRRRRRRRHTSGDDAHPPHDRTAREGDPEKQRDESATGPTSADATPSRDGGSQIEGGSKSGKRRRRRRRRRAPRDGGPNRDAPDPS
ncbi:MAG: hypothetical protein IIB55_00850 [Planctomycetes bacterium]|nr:hypothetical protein [Planctomycetota bacterium]